MNIKNYVFINQVVLKFVGLYPIGVTRYLVCVSCIMLIIIPQVTLIYVNWNDIDIVLEASSSLLTISLAVFKSIIWMLNKEKLEAFVKFLLSDYWKLVKDNVFLYLQEYAIYAKTITKGYLISMCNALLFFFSLPIIDTIITKYKSPNNLTEKHFPFAAIYPAGFYKFPYYEIAYTSQILATSICALVMLATDSLIATALLHTCGHFVVLKRKLMELDSNIHRMISSQHNTKRVDMDLCNVKYQLANIIKHHQIVLWFCECMEENFHMMLFLQTMCSSLIICLVGFQVSSTLTERSKLIMFASHLIVALFQLLLFCFPGDILIRQSFSVSICAYSMKWFELPTMIKNEVCMIMLRSQSPSYVSAGKLYVMHLENFSATLSTAFSYFMMLRSFDTEP